MKLEIILIKPMPEQKLALITSMELSKFSYNKQQNWFLSIPNEKVSFWAATDSKGFIYMDASGATYKTNRRYFNDRIERGMITVLGNYLAPASSNKIHAYKFFYTELENYDNSNPKLAITDNGCDITQHTKIDQHFVKCFPYDNSKAICLNWQGFATYYHLNNLTQGDPQMFRERVFIEELGGFIILPNGDYLTQKVEKAPYYETNLYDNFISGLVTHNKYTIIGTINNGGKLHILRNIVYIAILVHKYRYSSEGCWDMIELKPYVLITADDRHGCYIHIFVNYLNIPQSSLLLPAGDYFYSIIS